MTLGELLKKRSEKFSHRLSLITPERKITYQELNRRVNQLANFLLKKGLQKGSTVGILSRNSIEFVITLFSLFKIGGIAVPLNYMLNKEEIYFILRDSHAVWLICSEEFLTLAEELFSRLEDLENILVVEREWQENPSLSQVFHISSSEEPPIQTGEEDVALLLYTSGTTGAPKGVMLTHKNILSDVEACLKRVRVTPRDKFSLLLPLFHSFTFTACLITPLYQGASSIIIKSLTPFREAIKTLFRNRVTVLLAIPSIFSLLAEVNPPFFLRNPLLRKFFPLRFGVSGGEKLSAEKGKKFSRLWRTPLLEGYGLTEASPVVSLNPLSKPKWGSAGPPLPGIQVKIVDEEGKEVKKGEVGEIILKGPTVMKGYYNRPRETEEVIKEGWLYTGDLGKIDEEGYLYIIDRKKDLIVVKGLNIYPKEIEEILNFHPKVKECAVVGIKRKDKGEVPVAFVVPKEEEKLTEEELKKHCQSLLASYKIPRRFEIRKELPKSSTGKILKKVLRQEKIW